MKTEIEIPEYADGKRVWYKVEDVDDSLYLQHYHPTLHNKSIKILTTEQYIPPWLRPASIDLIGKLK